MNLSGGRNSTFDAVRANNVVYANADDQSSTQSVVQAHSERTSAAASAMAVDDTLRTDLTAANMTNTVAVDVTFFLARCVGDLELQMRRPLDVPALTNIEALTTSYLAKDMKRVLASIRETCFGYIVTKATSAGRFTPLFLDDDWETTMVHHANHLEVIFLENGYRKPLRDINLYSLLEQCIRRLDPTADGVAVATKRPAVDTASPVPQRRRRTDDGDPNATFSHPAPLAASAAHAPRSADSNPAPSSSPTPGDLPAVDHPSIAETVAVDSTAAPAMATSTPVQPSVHSTAFPPTATPTSAQSRTSFISLRPVAHSTPLASTTAAAASALPPTPSADAAFSSMFSDNTASVFQLLPVYTSDTTDASENPISEEMPSHGELQSADNHHRDPTENNVQQEQESEEVVGNQEEQSTPPPELEEEPSAEPELEEEAAPEPEPEEQPAPEERPQGEKAPEHASEETAEPAQEESSAADEELSASPESKKVAEEAEAESSSDNESVHSESSDGGEAGGDDEPVDESALADGEEASLHSDSEDGETEHGDDDEASEASDDAFSEHTDDEEMELEKNKMLKKKGDKHGYDPVRRTDRKKHPPGFQRPLLPHQLDSLGWLRRHELNEDHCGGILADEPGSGKTITVAAFLVYMKPHNRRLPAQIGGKRRANALIVVPKSVLIQWEAQLAREFLVPGALKVVLFYGPKRLGIPANELAEADAVITTPDILRIDVKGYAKGGRSSELPRNRLGQFHWTRFIVDEAHRNRSEESNSTLALQAIFATYRWCMSGTPIDGCASDAKKLLSFLGCPLIPWKSLTLRQTKEDIVKVKKIFRTLNVHMKGIERKAYEQMTQFLKTWREEDRKDHAWRAENRKAVRQQIERENPRPSLAADDSDDDDVHWNYGYHDSSYRRKIDELCEAHPDYNKHSPRWESLTKTYPSYSKLSGNFGDRLLGLRFKQAAVHPAVAEKAVDKDLAMKEALSAVDADVRRQLLEGGSDASSIYEPGFESAKIKALLSKLVPIVESGEKCSVVTQYRSALKIVGVHLSKKGITYDTMHGGTTAENRWDIIRRFNDPNSELKVVLLAIQSCGVGVDLPGGNHMFLLEPQESGADEEQAFDRSHRIGQTKDVYCHRMITVDTIEEEIAQQRKKRVAATNNLLGNRSA